MSRSSPLFNCLIRTHHITSRKKLWRVRRAAENLNVDWLLVKSGSPPGLMFAEARDLSELTEWVSTVQSLRYKDYRCVAKPAPAPAPEGSVVEDKGVRRMGFEETTEVKEFAKAMEERGLGGWWKRGMGYE
ncbi:unnamed protein product [Fusarium equiseti]|uniref:Uncharacterized protein n=1 Tax=Fusarium equiseti TaxID=61235 RepID=A0A8J2IK08_FUSEQ|nr:unnamed protein product [Fusarium equiseti]